MAKNTTEILNAYTKGEATLAATNAALKSVGATFHLDPKKNEIKEEDKEKFGLLDTGTGSLDKVAVADGLIADDLGNLVALCFYNGEKYRVVGRKLVECK